MHAPEHIRRQVAQGIIRPVAEMLTGHRSRRQLARRLSPRVRYELQHSTLQVRPRPELVHVDVLVYRGRLEASAVFRTADASHHPLALAIDRHHGTERIIAIACPWLQLGT